MTDHSRPGADHSRPDAGGPDPGAVEQALRADERLVPDLAAVRRDVLAVHRRRRAGRQWIAGMLVAAGVVVVSTVVSVAAFRARTSDTPLAANASTAAMTNAGVAPGSTPPAPPATVDGATAPSAPPDPSPSESAVVAPQQDTVIRIWQAPDPDRELAHCRLQFQAWPVLSAQAGVHERSLRGALNECVNGYLPTDPAPAVQYAHVPLSAVAAVSPPVATAASAARADEGQPVVVVRATIETERGGNPVTVQLYLGATPNGWIGADVGADVPQVAGAFTTMP